MFRDRKIKPLSIVLTFLLCFGLPGFGPAFWQRPLAANQRIDAGDQAALNRFQEQIKEMNERTKQLQQEQKDVAAQQQNLLGEMKLLSADIDELQTEIEFLEEQIILKEDEILVMEYHIELKTEDVRQRSEYLNIRLVQIYLDGDVPLLDVVMESTSVTDFLTRFDMITTVVNNDMVL